MKPDDVFLNNQDLTGQTFGYWTALKKIGRYSGTKYLCRCVCGTEREIQKANLLRGCSKSCGCMKSSFLDRGRNDSLIGRQFGFWTVLDPEEEGVQPKTGFLYCRCVCGTEKMVNKAHLIHGKSKSCGCHGGEINVTINTGDDGPVKTNVPPEYFIGQTFGCWTVLALDEQRKGYYYCRCVCGTVRSVGRNYLLNGSSRSCGCTRKRNADGKNDDDLVGKQFGFWTILYPVRIQERGRNAYLHCRCVCGTERDVLRYEVLSGQSQSCGCRKAVNRNKKKIEQGPEEQKERIRLLSELNLDPDSLLGRKFGDWRVLRKDDKKPYRYICRCVCGREKSVNQYLLLNGESKSCGCRGGVLQPRDLLQTDPVGKSFGFWTVLAPDESRRYYYRCRCVCGTEKSVQVHALFRGETKSCGCMKGAALRILDEMDDSLPPEELRDAVLKKLHEDPDNLVGKSFGAWTVLRKDDQKPYRYICRCVCGREKSVNQYLLLNNESRSCVCRGRS